jgi:LSD1 subclass zinc finger protein
VPVFTLHDMHLETNNPVPVIICTGCQHPIPAPRGSAAIQCRDCGKKMQIVSISPANQATRAT